MLDYPHVITLSKNLGKSGNISFLEESQDMFPIKRVYWIYDVTESALRGNHSHLNSERIIVALQGKVEVEIESVQGENYSFVLRKPSEALFVPRLHWIRLKCEKNAILVVLSSCLFEDDVVITDYNEFKRLKFKSQMS